MGQRPIPVLAHLTKARKERQQQQLQPVDWAIWLKFYFLLCW